MSTITLVHVTSDKSRVITEHKLAELAVEINGGGYSVQHTMNAMAWQRAVLASDTPVEFEHKGQAFTVQVVQTEPVL